MFIYVRFHFSWINKNGHRVNVCLEGTLKVFSKVSSIFIPTTGRGGASRPVALHPRQHLVFSIAPVVRSTDSTLASRA